MPNNLLSVVWIDWYAYHVARFRALTEHPQMRGRVTGLELVGGAGVHQQMVFRDSERHGLSVSTLLPDAAWSKVRQDRLSALVWRKLDEADPQAVLVPGYYTAPALAAALWAKRRGRRSILMTETTRQDHPRVRWKEAVKARLLNGLFDAAIAGGQRHADYLDELGFPRERVARKYDVVDNKYFCREADRCRASRGSATEPYFLYVGRLAAEKNVSGLVRAFAHFRSRGGTWPLILAGDGPLAGALKEQVSAAGLEHSVRFAGLLPTASLVPHYAFAGCFILPSFREPWGLVVNEAMAAGLPVIVSGRCGCVDDLVESGRNGYTFNPLRDGELSECMLRMARASARDRENMAQASRRIIADYSLEHWAEEVYRVISNLSVA